MDESAPRATKSELHNERADFLAVLNHRLRTPIIANDRVVELMLNGAFGEFEPKQREILLHLQQNNRELDRLVSMLSDLYKYKTRSKSLQLAVHDLTDVVNIALARITTFAAAKNIQICVVVEPKCSVKCDDQEIAMLISHLLENAVKYGRNRVTLNASRLAAVIEIEVEDDGPGIEEADIPLLFDRFFVNFASGKYAPATGTGLCLCAEIAKAHGGTIQCFSVPDEGTKFVVSLPVSS